jgi:hypothetical protein
MKLNEAMSKISKSELKELGDSIRSLYYNPKTQVEKDPPHSTLVAGTLKKMKEMGYTREQFEAARSRFRQPANSGGYGSNLVKKLYDQATKRIK